MAIKCPNCGGEFDERLSKLLRDTGVHVVVCGKCNRSFPPESIHNNVNRFVRR